MPTPAAAASARQLRHDARSRRGNRRRDGVDVLLEGGHSGAVRIGLVRELHHVVQEIAPRIHEVELALQLRDLRLQRATLLGFRAGELPLRGCDLRLDRGPARVQIALVSAAALAASSRLGRGVLLHLRLAAQELGVRARKLERERDDAVRGLPVGIEDQQVARLRGGLLLDAEHSVPVHRLVENADDLVARHDGAGGERRRGARLHVLGMDPRRQGQGKTDRCDSLEHGANSLQVGELVYAVARLRRARDQLADSSAPSSPDLRACRP